MTKRWSFAAWTNSASFHWVRQEMGAAWPDCAPRGSAAHGRMNEPRRDGRIVEVTLLLRYPCLFARPRLLDSVDHQLMHCAIDQPHGAKSPRRTAAFPNLRCRRLPADLPKRPVFREVPSHAPPPHFASAGRQWMLDAWPDLFLVGPCQSRHLAMPH